jgi:uncharacterized iron-regulated protein
MQITRAVRLFIIALLLLYGCASAPYPEAAEPFPHQAESPYRDLDTLEEETILHIPTGREMTPAELIQYLGPSRIIYIGEVHTNIHHHRVQLEILKGLVDQYPGKITVGMEMFKYPSQEFLDHWSRGELDEKTMARVFYENWNQDFDYYQEILKFIRDQKLPLVALNTSDEELRLLSEKGFSEMTEAERDRLPDLDATDPYHRRSMEAIFGGHVHGQKGFDPFYQTMLLWDETMAQRIVTFLKSKKGQDKRMVVLTGGFHVSYGYGIPRRVFRQFPEPYTTVLPFTSKVPVGKEYVIMEKVTPPNLPLPIADIVWNVPYEDLEDRRVKLGVQIAPSKKGVLIQAVGDESSAEQAGLLAGDVVTDFDRSPVVEPFDLIYEIRKKKPGERASVKVLREDQMLELEVKF